MAVKKNKPEFGRSLSFKKLFDYYLDSAAEEENPTSKKIYNIFFEYLRENPELLEKVSLKTYEKHKNYISATLKKFFQITPESSTMGAATIPFENNAFYQTENFSTMTDHTISFSHHFHNYSFDIDKMQYLHGYSFIYRKFFDLDYTVDLPMIKYRQDEATGLIRCYRINVDTSFVDVTCIDDSFDFAAIDRNLLMENLTNLEAILKLLPPEKFEFSGFLIHSAVDVTDSEVLSILKHELIENSFLKEKEKFLKVQNLVRSYFGVPDIELGIVGFLNNEILILNSGYHASNECIYRDSKHFSLEDFRGSVYEKAVAENRDVVISDLKMIEDKHDIEKMLIEKGGRNIIVSPLTYDGDVIGTLHMISPSPCSMCGTDIYKLNELKPLFSLSLKRSIEEFNSNVQIVIQNKFTAIHPSVEWKFREAAVKYIDDQAHTAEPCIEPIVFQDVYPLFGVSDIRGSSSHRNNAIREDILVHLEKAREILDSAWNYQKIPVLDEMIFRTDQNIDKAREGLSSGDEIEIINFVNSEIEPSLPHLRDFSKDTSTLIDNYYRMKDEDHNTIYSRRKAFDESVLKINQVISSYLDSAQIEAQRIYPHYFEKQSTDGVDFSMYIGSQLSNKITYNSIYLKNLRLWQLIALANIANISEKLKQKTPVALDTTHLIVVQDMPITISFDFEEKGFHVEGAYNIRYEIIKKRIDKAVIKGSGERLTQPGKIAVVYSQLKEKSEYLRYLNYLISRGYLTGEVEEHELDDLQGVRGLKALRVSAAIDNKLVTEPVQKIIEGAFV